MYGYFDYRNAYLRNNERVIFTCYYCRLCYCLWNKGGQKARYLTTYDATLYNLILAVAGLDSCPPALPCERVKTNNKKSFKNDKIGNLIADLSVIGFAVKVKDDQTDGDGKRAFIANLFFKKLMNRTVESHRELFDREYASILELDRLQKANAPVEEVLNLYGDTMEDAFHSFFDLEDKYLRVVNALARWSFLIDMIDDYDKDFKSGAVNSFYRADCPTVQALFEKYYYDFLPVIQSVRDDLHEALQEITCEKTEWVILNKILSHSLATLIPDILAGLDVRYHYFRDTVASWKRLKDKRKFQKKHEKNSDHH